MASTGLVTLLLIVMVIIALIIFILSIYQLYSIRKTSGYSQSTSLQNAYDFSIGVLVLNIFVFIFFVAAIGIYIRNKQKRSGSLVTVIIFATLTLFGGIIVGGYAAAASKNGAAIGNLVTMIIGYVPPDVAAKCGEITHQTAAAQLSSVANQYLTLENIQTAAKLGELL
jgi:uncharacterized BrkB/YihY/UPF0761 family membrane protein